MKRSFLRRPALCAAALALTAVLLTACGGGTLSGVGSTSGGTSSTSTASLPDLSVTDETSAPAAQPAEGTALSYSESITGRLFSKITSGYTMECNLTAVVNGETITGYSYYTTNGTKVYIDSTFSDDDIDDLHVLSLSSKIGYVLNAKKHQAYYYSDGCITVNHPIESVRTALSGSTLTAGTETLNGASYYCETAKYGSYTYTFYYDANNTLKYIRISVGGSTETQEILKLSATCMESKFSLDGYKVVYGYTFSF